MMNLLFIEQGSGNYGAQRSLGEMIKGLDMSYKNVNIYLMLDLLSCRKNINKKKTFNTHLFQCKNKTVIILPSLSSVSTLKLTYVSYFKALLRFLCFLIFYKKKFQLFLETNKIDVVHLNNSSLWPLINYIKKDVKIVFHERGIQSNNKNRMIHSMMNKMLKKVQSIITIGDLECQYYNELGFSKQLILHNPVDMSSVESLSKNKIELFKKYNIKSGQTVVAFIGYLDRLKGVNFFLKAIDFINSVEKNDNYRWIIVGDTPDLKYKRDILKQINQLFNTAYLGEVSSIEDIYSLADVIVRCEPFFSLGRTVFEAYYSHKQILIPSKKMEEPSLDLLFDNNTKFITLYKARDCNSFKSSLQVALKNITVNSMKTYPTYGNILTYCSKLMDIYMGLIK